MIVASAVADIPLPDQVRAHLVKPFEVSELVELISTLLVVPAAKAG